MKSTINAQVSINGSPFYPAEIRHDMTVEYVRAENATRPDPAWEISDSSGHFHAFAEDGKTPTLETYLVHVACDGTCGGICEGEGYEQERWKCVICGEETEPRFIPDEDARMIGVPVITSRKQTITMHVPGALPPIGQQDNGDGTFTLTPEVTIQARTAGHELIGTGHARLDVTYRKGGGTEWTATVHGPPLQPRLT